MSDYGFIMTRHVHSETTNKYWNHSVKLLQFFYPDKQIIIIDDNSNKECITDIKLINTKNEKKLIKIMQESKKIRKKIVFLSTPQNKTDLDLLLDLGISAIKIGSDDFTNLPLIKQYSSTKLPLILSCGMANLSEICTSLNVIGAFDGYPTILLHTTSQYPTPKKDVNLLKLKTLQTIFPNIPLGFSDHTQGSLASSLAVSFGACVFEKHFTLNKNRKGLDHSLSADPSDLKIISGFKIQKNLVSHCLNALL